MAKFHINVATGKSGKCTATVRPCPYGELGVHFETKERAEQFAFLNASATPNESGSLVSSESTFNDQKHLSKLVQNEDFVGLREFVEERAQAEVYQDAIAQREEYRAELAELTNEIAEVKKKTRSADPAVAADARLKERDLTLEYRETFEDFALLRAQLDEYRVLTAQAALSASIFQEEKERAAGVFLEYDKDRLGDLEALGEYESGSPEWHAARAAGIGGSDVGAIMRANKDYASVNFTRLTATKLGLEVPGDSVPGRDDLRSAIGRGNAWEEYIRHTVALNNPDENIAFCKTSWHGIENPHRHANFDGLILDDNGNPEGIVEIKTGSDPTKWGSVETGLDGVPPEYKKQVLWYAMNGGLKHGKIVAVLDDYDYREYKFSMDDPKIKAEVAEIASATDAFWEDIQNKKAQLEAGIPLSRKKQTRGMKASLDYDSIAEVYAGYAGVSLSEAKEKIVTTVESEKAAKGRMLTDSEFQKAAVGVFAAYDPSSRKKPLIGVDIETTTTTPRTGRIIETGIAELGRDGNTSLVYGSTHDIPAKAKAGVGLGASDLHKISPEMIEGRPSFDTPEEQKRILNHLKSGTLVAHNASFEDRFFSANLPGYVEAKNAGEINILDTRKLSRLLMPRSDDSSLESFAEDNGVPYEGAHAAPQDALMMMKALGRLQESLHKTGSFRTKRVTDNLRVAAKKEALSNEEAR